MTNMNIEQEIEKITQRNKRVEEDKAWETSFFRRGFIAVITYLAAWSWLMLIHEPLSFLKALVPVFGFLISTFSLPILKSRWIKNQLSNSRELESER